MCRLDKARWFGAWFLGLLLLAPSQTICSGVIQVQEAWVFNDPWHSDLDIAKFIIRVSDRTFKKKFTFYHPPSGWTYQLHWTQDPDIEKVRFEHMGMIRWLENDPRGDFEILIKEPRRSEYMGVPFHGHIHLYTVTGHAFTVVLAMADIRQEKFEYNPISVRQERETTAALAREINEGNDVSPVDVVAKVSGGDDSVNASAVSVVPFLRFNRAAALRHWTIKPRRRLVSSFLRNVFGRRSHLIPWVALLAATGSSDSQTVECNEVLPAIIATR